MTAFFCSEHDKLEERLDWLRIFLIAAITICSGLPNSCVFSDILNFCPRNYKRKLNGIDILPASDFLKDIWNDLVI